MKNDDVYAEWRDKLLWIIGHKICKGCNNPQKLNVRMDYENPLKCGCHCERIDKVLVRVAEIDNDIAEYSGH